MHPLSIKDISQTNVVCLSLDSEGGPPSRISAPTSTQPLDGKNSATSQPPTSPSSPPTSAHYPAANGTSSSMVSHSTSSRPTSSTLNPSVTASKLGHSSSRSLTVALACVLSALAVFSILLLGYFRHYRGRTRKRPDTCPPPVTLDLSDHGQSASVESESTQEHTRQAVESSFVRPSGRNVHGIEQMAPQPFQSQIVAGGTAAQGLPHTRNKVSNVLDNVNPAILRHEGEVGRHDRFGSRSEHSEGNLPPPSYTSVPRRGQITIFRAY